VDEVVDGALDAIVEFEVSVAAVDVPVDEFIDDVVDGEGVVDGAVAVSAGRFMFELVVDGER